MPPLHGQMMTHVVDALGSNKGPDLDRAALTMVDVATNVGSDESVSRGCFVMCRDFFCFCHPTFLDPRLWPRLVLCDHLVPKECRRACSTAVTDTTIRSARANSTVKAYVRVEVIDGTRGSGAENTSIHAYRFV